ncbi:MAG TPA: MauE/DoxX family redox-associated membrane protein [Chloroflexota bacterium]
MAVRTAWAPGLLLAARLVVGAIFLLAGIDKVLSPGGFADSVRAFHLLPPALVLPFAFVIPWIELLVAVYLITGYLCRFAAAGTIALLAMFIFALGTALVSGDTNHACGCFGTSGDANRVLALLEGGSTIGWWDVIRDLIMIGMTIPLVLYGAGSVSVDALLARRAGKQVVSGFAPTARSDG